ncbi:MAG: SDR family NAD(P)-dependent oxidoreductase [Devosia ginsengisoli]|nr:SDR family NAD(P)-dependent oxidoreductase [Devosia ginsengisoli]MCR6670747.1 SDR family NAD(P)-dependent oxidoreductase [Devosia ginsengisoli]
MASIEMKIARRVLISGAAGGIGGTLAQKLVAAGSSVIGTDRRAPADDWSGQPWLIADVGTSAGREVIANGISDDIDGLIFAAGMLDPDGWASITEDEAASLLAVNLTAPLFLTRLLLPRLKPGASIVIIGSIAGMRGSPATPFMRQAKRDCET